MKSVLILIAAVALFNNFKETQLSYPRVKSAYADKESMILKNLYEVGLEIENLEIQIHAYKSESHLKIWGRNDSTAKFKLIKTFDICEKSGKLGPKSRRGDNQVPEGFYTINRFNPESSFHLSLGLDYPNPSDRIRSMFSNLGGDIFIHGSCVTIGCLPMNDDQIKEIYIYCVEATDQGQEKIPVIIFPKNLNEKNYNQICTLTQDTTVLNLWEDLKKFYDLFDRTKGKLEIEFLKNGRHGIGL